MELFTNTQMTVLATGGYGRVTFRVLLPTCTGDGNGMVARAGLPLQDMVVNSTQPVFMVLVVVTEGARERAIALPIRRGSIHGALRSFGI